MYTKTSINLQPWRLIAHRKRRRNWFCLSALMLVSNLCLWLGFSAFNREHNQALGQQTLALQQLQLQIHQQTQQLNQQRAQYSGSGEMPIEPARLNILLDLLHQLPLTEGELLRFSAHYRAEDEAEQKLHIQLQGWADNHQEFEQIQAFLNHQDWLAQRQLQQLEPQPDQRLRFEFALSAHEVSP